jgi:uncharacterized protein (TIGR03084 family)
MDDDFAALLDALAAEQHQLQAALGEIGPDDWFRPTPAKGWDVRDTIAHLADTDEAAIDTCTGGRRPLNEWAARFSSSDDVTLWGVLQGRKLDGNAVLRWWEDSSHRIREVLAGIDPAMRVEWGIGMRPRSLATARLMEVWAHGLDVRDALGWETVDTDTLRHVAWLGYRALPYAYTRSEREAPPGELRIELMAPDGTETWEFGPVDAPNRITGPASQFCRLFVQRITRAEATELEAEGEVADAALDVARAFL